MQFDMNNRGQVYTNYYMPDQPLDQNIISQPLNQSPSQNDTSENGIGNKKKRTRARGEALDVLKSEFVKNPNPSSKRRKILSELTGLSEKKIRIWFQNRRAKMRKNDRTGNNSTKYTSEISKTPSNQNAATSFFDSIPLTSNNNYYFIDVCSVTVGSWNRMKSGSLYSKYPNELFSTVSNITNLSPMSLNSLMLDKTDLIILVSKKNYEINYFFSAMANNTRILFRIFFPISSITNCSLVLETDDIISNEKSKNTNEDNFKLGELKLSLSRSPNFAVFFLDQQNLNNINSNQWSICEDFSEGRQVSDAFIGGSNISHVLKGLQDSLRFINSLILDYNSTNHIQSQQSSNSNSTVALNTQHSLYIPHKQQQMQEPQQQQSFPQIHQQQQRQQFTQQPVISRNPMVLNMYNQSPQQQQQQTQQTQQTSQLQSPPQAPYQSPYLDSRNQQFFFDNNETPNLLNPNIPDINSYQVMMDPSSNLNNITDSSLNSNIPQSHLPQLQMQQTFNQPPNNNNNTNMLVNTPEFFRSTSDMHSNVNNNNFNTHDNNVINRWL